MSSFTTDMPNDWQAALQSELQKPYFVALAQQVDREYTQQTIYPPRPALWEAFSLTSLSSVKVVILGQDPYHGPNQAHGLAFSVPNKTALPPSLPPSLRNIYKEIAADIGSMPPESGNLSQWATQGVLLLNSTLTVRAGAAGSHHTLGWESFTNTVIQTISDQQPAVVFLLWGAHAQAKSIYIDPARHLTLTAPHPSPLSAHRGFIGCRHFSQTNAFLEARGLSKITW